jgi:hypothetical protein
LTLELERQLSEYGRQLNTHIDDIDPDDAQEIAPRHRIHGAWLVSIGAAAATILVVGLLPLLLSPNGPAPNQTIGAGTAELFVAELFVADLRGPNNVAVDSSGRLIILEHNPGRVIQIEVLADGTAGETVTIVPDPGEDLHALALDANGVVHYTNYDDVFRLSDEANPPTYDWAPFIGGLLGGYGYEGVPALAIDDDGDLYVAGFVESGIRITKVEVLPNGEAGTPIELATAAVLRGPADAYVLDIVYAPTNQLFVVNGTGKVWVVTLSDDGSVDSMQVFATVAGSAHSLDVDPSGRIYVATDLGTVWRITSDGGTIAVASGFEDLGSIAVGDSGVLYLVEGDDILRLDSG